MLQGCFEDFREIIKTSFRYLEPGGWMESVEIYPTLFCEDDSLRENYPLVDYLQKQDEAAMALQRPLRTGNKLKRWYEEAGFVDVDEEVYCLPINDWPKCPQWRMLGKYYCRLLADSLQGHTYRSFHEVFGWNQLQTETYLINVRNSLKDKKVHAYQKVYVSISSKPDD
jgi:hypothetical protein